MKVLMVDPSNFTPFYDHCLCEALSKRGCDITFITSKYLYGKYDYPINYKQVNLFYNFTYWLYSNQTTGSLRTQVKGCEHIYNLIQLFYQIKRINPDIIHFQWMPFPFFDAMLVKYLKKTAPVVITVHDVMPYHKSASSKFQLFNFYPSLGEFDHLIVHTQSAYNTLVNEAKISKNNMSIVPFGLIDNYIKNTAPAEIPKQNKKTILCFGTIKPYKGIDILLKGFAGLPKKILEQTMLVIAGAPKMDINPLLILAKDLGINDHIEWVLNYIPEDKIGEILSKATLFVLPYRHFKSQSGVLMSILPVGKPIIATKMSGFTEILKDNVHGRLIEPENPNALRAALEYVLSSNQRIEEMSRAVKKLSESIDSWDSIALKTKSIYMRLISRQLQSINTII